MIISLNDYIMSLENMQRSERKASIKSIIKPQGSKFRTTRVKESFEVRLEELNGQLTSCSLNHGSYAGFTAHYMLSRHSFFALFFFNAFQMLDINWLSVAL